MKGGKLRFKNKYINIYLVFIDNNFYLILN